MSDEHPSPGSLTAPPAGDVVERLAVARRWAERRTYALADVTAEQFAERKRSAGTTVSIVIPAKSVADTIGDIVRCCVRLRELGGIDEVLVINAATTNDGTAEVAAAAGATVYAEDALVPEFGPVRGKGDAMWRAQAVATGDLIVFVDGDSAAFSDRFVIGLASPLIDDPSLALVKGAYRRPFTDAGVRVADGGGRVSELTARPLLNLFYPELSAVQQPLAGEFAARRDALAQLPILTGYGAEIQLLIDFLNEFGLDAIAQSELGERINRHQPLHALGEMSFTVARAILARADVFDASEQSDEFLNYVEGRPRQRPVPLIERPPFASIVGEDGDGA